MIYYPIDILPSKKIWRDDVKEIFAVEHPPCLKPVERRREAARLISVAEKPTAYGRYFTNRSWGLTWCFFNQLTLW